MAGSRGKRLKWNTITSLMFQITTVVCGFILPRLILHAFGSTVNGLVHSITQFLHIITFLELGVGAVVQSTLYKPLAERDMDQVSRVTRSAGKFFATIAKILLGYLILLVIFYPMFVKDFDHLYTALLIAAISISSFARYYFGIVDRLLLTADQRGFIQYTAQTATLILNTAACAVLIHFGCSIHIVKLTTSCIYLIRPIFLRWYVNRHYHINRKIEYTEEPIKQKWNGIAQHIAAVVLDQTDIIVLTVLSTLENVSIYSVYHTVIYGVKNILRSMTNGVEALMGDYLHSHEKKKLQSLFDWTEWLLHTGTVFLFGCTGVLVMPFITVYTKGITDANYMVPAFAILITVANAGHCLRLPYNIVILAAGHYKQTQSNYIIAAVLNIVISVLTVKFWGLIGVAIGTLVAMCYQTVWMAYYDSKHILNTSMRSFWKQIFVDALTVAIAVPASMFLPMRSVSYFSWVLLAIPVSLIWLVVVLIVNMVFYRDKLGQMKNRVMGKIRRKAGKAGAAVE